MWARLALEKVAHSSLRRGSGAAVTRRGKVSVSAPRTGSVASQVAPAARPATAGPPYTVEVPRPRTSIESPEAIAIPGLSPAPAAAAGVHSALVDRFGRKHQYLRVSLTDRCNLRCQYCMPEEGEEDFIPSTKSEVLTSGELKRLFHLFISLGVRKIRFTGGEPTIRKDFGQIITDVGELNARLVEPLSLGITTNGVRLQKFLPVLRDAGLRNINLSLDTLVPAKFQFLARRSAAWHGRVMDTLRAVGAQDDFFRLKVNVVLMNGVNEDEIGGFIDLTEQWGLEVRFLEFMPFDGNAWNKGKMVPEKDIIASMQRHLDKRGLGDLQKIPPDSPSDVARLWQVPGFRGRLGTISSMTNQFCGGCNRIRITSSGELRNCLFGEEGWSLRDDLRTGVTDEVLTETIATAVTAKFAKLGGKKDMHDLNARGGLSLPMVALGG